MPCTLSGSGFSLGAVNGVITVTPGSACASAASAAAIRPHAMALPITTPCINPFGPMLRREARGSGDLQPAIGARDRLADTARLEWSRGRLAQQALKHGSPLL